MAFRAIQLKDKDKVLVGEALVSLEDYENVIKYTWNKSVNKRKDGEQVYVRGHINGVCTSMHQFIMGPPPNEELLIDHINHNGLDNRRCNLRFSTYSGNSQNKEKVIRENTTSEYIGVSKNKNDKFEVKHGGIYLGSFDSEVEAAKHYDKYVTIKYDGNCMLNFPDEPPENIDGVTLEDLNMSTRKLRTLPEHIAFHKTRGKYFAQRMFHGEAFASKHVDTLDKALEDLDIINAEIKKLEDEFLIKHNEKAITRNENHQAIISVKNGQNQNEFAIVDDIFWHELMLAKWSIKDGYAQAKINKSNVLMHSFIMKKTQINIDRIDHINNNRLDNRVSNLRSVSAAINAHNKKKKEGCSSNYTGVCKNGTKWTASINFNHTQIWLGTYGTEVKAAKAYNEKAKELYKENARLNEITE